MKNRLGFLAFVLLVFSMWSAPSFAQESKGQLSNILQNSEEINYSTREKLYKILTLDVFGYYDLSDYNTDLKKNMFMKTAEYTNKVNELKKLKQTSLSRAYYVTVKGDRLKNYDIKRKGFKIEVGSNVTFGGTLQRSGPPKSISQIIFPALIIESEAWKSFMGERMPDGIKIDYLFLTMNEQNGLAVENNRSDINIYFVFSPADAKKVSYDHYAAGGNHGWVSIKDDCIIAKSVRVVVANEKSGEVYLDKYYK